MTEDVKRYIQAARLTASEMDDTLTTTDVHDLYDAVEIGRDKLFEMADLIEQLTAELEQVKRERDAAVKELSSAVDACEYCSKLDTRLTCPEWQECNKCCGWKWRGPCAENGGAEDA